MRRPSEALEVDHQSLEIHLRFYVLVNEEHVCVFTIVDGRKAATVVLAIGASLIADMRPFASSN